MNLKQFKTNITNVKNMSPEIYKETMKVSIPFFVLHNQLYSTGEEILSNDFNINQSELDVLSSLYYMSEGTSTLTPTQLYDVMLFSSGGMTKLLKKLETKDFIVRLDNEEDKRSKLVKITRKGIEVIVAALDKVVTYEDKYFSRLNVEEQELFRTLIYKMLDEKDK